MTNSPNARSNDELEKEPEENRNAGVFKAEHEEEAERVVKVENGESDDDVPNR